MQVPEICGRIERVDAARGRWRSRCWVGCVAVLGFLLYTQAWGAEKKPWLELPLQSLGFPGVSTALRATGSSVLTVHFLDSSHLLVTYNLRKLVPRVERDPEDHEDRLVAGEIVDLPSGHVQAITEWHMHDHGRYLWAMGRGRFLIRIGEQMYTMEPLAHLGERDPFARVVFPSRPGRPNLVVVSPEGGVVTVETVYEAAEQGGGTKVVLGDADTAPVAKSRTTIDFFRVEEAGVDGGFSVRAAGGVQSAGPVFLPVDADGYLWAVPVGSGAWAVTFDGFGGKTLDLGTIQSSCRPRLQMAGRSEFLAMTCQGSDDRIKMASYGLDGHDTWEDPIGDFGHPAFAFAPAAARFAVSGTTSEEIQPQGPVPGDAEIEPRQEVRVYQNASGDMLLRVECTPVFKTAENFDLSADGMLAAVVRNGAVAIYKLPPLSKRDKDDMVEIGSYAPAVSDADVVLKRLTVPVKAARRRTEGEATGLVAGPQTIVDLGSSAAASPRRPPTLLNPGEKPAFGAGNAEPK